MAKKCDKYGCTPNPDNAHYCGSSGSPLEKEWNGIYAKYKVVKERHYNQLLSDEMRYRHKASQQDHILQDLEKSKIWKIRTWLYTLEGSKLYIMFAIGYAIFILNMLISFFSFLDIIFIAISKDFSMLFYIKIPQFLINVSITILSWGCFSSLTEKE